MNELQQRRLPIRQTASILADTRRQAFGDGLVDWLSKRERYALVRREAAYGILAENETALAEAQTVLRAVHGRSVAFGPAWVHTYADPFTGRTMEPHAFVRIDAPRAWFEFFAADLRARGATVQEVDLRRDRVVVRAEARLAAVYGYERAVAVLTDGSAHTLLWLTRYAPVDAGAPADPDRPDLSLANTPSLLARLAMPWLSRRGGGLGRHSA